MKYLHNDKFSHLDEGFRITGIDPLDEAYRLVKVALEKQEIDKNSVIEVTAIHNTKIEVDEEFNYWRSLKATSYLKLQTELLK